MSVAYIEKLSGWQRLGSGADAVISVGGLPVGGSGVFLKSFMPGVAKNIAKSGAKRAALNLGKSAAVEGAEETVQAVAEDLSDDGKLNAGVKSYLQAGAQGALGGGMFHGAGVGISGLKSKVGDIKAGGLRNAYADGKNNTGINHLNSNQMKYNMVEVVGGIKGIKDGFQTKFVDKLHPIESKITDADQKADMRGALDKTIRADAIAGAFMRDKGLEATIHSFRSRSLRTYYFCILPCYNIFMNTPLPGVNLGGWLVLERWMTPSLFTGTSAKNEYELSQLPGRVRAIQQHHNTFITEQDIAWLQKAGVKVLRVPIGFWILHGYHPYVSARGRLEWLFDMAKKYDIQILLCLHAAPGPQNNNDHSGSGQPGGVPGWYSRLYRQMTRDILVELADMYGNHPYLWGIELLNEPHTPTSRHRHILWRWTGSMLSLLRKKLPNSVRLVVSDCFNPQWWSGKIGDATLDIHHYQCFSDEHIQYKNVEQHIDALKRQVKTYQQLRHQPKIIGEWSAALPSNVQGLQANKAFLRAQLEVAADVDAWFFWSYKTERKDNWNFRHLYEQGYFKGCI